MPIDRLSTVDNRRCYYAEIRLLNNLLPNKFGRMLPKIFVAQLCPFPNPYMDVKLMRAVRFNFDLRVSALWRGNYINRRARSTLLAK